MAFVAPIRDAPEKPHLCRIRQIAVLYPGSRKYGLSGLTVASLRPYRLTLRSTSAVATSCKGSPLSLGPTRLAQDMRKKRAPESAHLPDLYVPNWGFDSKRAVEALPKRLTLTVRASTNTPQKPRRPRIISPLRAFSSRGSSPNGSDALKTSRSGCQFCILNPLTGHMSE
jgi:hypothetical protein